MIVFYETKDAFFYDKQKSFEYAKNAVDFAIEISKSCMNVETVCEGASTFFKKGRKL